MNDGSYPKQSDHCGNNLYTSNLTFVTAKEDDSHTSLFFDAMGSRIFGRWIDTPEGNRILSCRLPVRRFE